MRQFIAIFAAFLLMPLLIKGIPMLIKKKPGFGPVLMITGVALALIAGLSVETTVGSFTKIFTSFSTVQIIIAIVEVGVLGALLKHYGFLDKIVSALETLIPAKKVIMMVLPAVMGLLSVPGGAYLSAPFVDKIGEEMEMPSEQRAAVNLSFRHIAMFLMPFTTNMLFIPTVIPEISIYQLIGLNLGFVIVMQTVSYFLYLHKCKAVKAQSDSGKKKAVLDLLYYLSPIYMVVLLNALFSLPMYLSVALSILLMFFLIGKEKKEFFPVAFKGISFNTMFMLIGVYFVQNLIKSLDQVMDSVVMMFQSSSGIGIMLVISAASLLFGLTTGLSLVPLGIILPLVAALPMDPAMKLLYTFFVFVWSFLGYYYSPLHLCQLLTIKYMGCPTWPVYKQHLRAIPFLMVASYCLFYLYRFLFI
ncbi:MAG: DUF401 family protein [Oscillospiraceae bacterium]|nr:DUF401 family protein [Oscillospiraceae bacterium]MBR6607592.1 DUF401 family protein [Oscillospiraceae bacterium]